MPRVKTPFVPNTGDENERLKEKILREAEEHRRIGGMTLREKMARQRVKVKKELGEVPDARDALALRILLPEEMWGCVFDYLTDDQDALACYHTCQLFSILLEKRRLAWMFKMVLPLGAPFLNKQDLLECRLVSRQWRLGVDRFVDLSASQSQLGSPFSSFDLPDKSYPELVAPFRFPLSPGSKQKLQELKNWVQATPKDNRLRVPSLVSGSVRLELEPPPDSDDSEDDESPEQYKWHRLQPQIQDTLALIGGSVSLLTLAIHPVVTFTNGMDSEDYCRVLEHILAQCASLKSLSLNTCTVKLTPFPPPPPSRPATLPDRPTLKHLRFHDANPHLSPCLDSLLHKYSAQLETLETRLWNASLFHRLPWPHLEKLGVTASHCTQWLPLLLKMKAPRLKMLGMKLGRPANKQSPQLRQVLKVVGSFARLEALELDFSAMDFGFQCHEIWEGLDPKQGLHALCTVTTLSLKLGNLSTCRTFGFLVYFPNVTSLSIFYRADQFHRNFPEDSADLVKLSHLLWWREGDDIEAPYKCSLWEVMPRLHSFQTVCTFLVNEEKVSKKLVYSRRGYEEYRSRERL